MKFDRSLFIGKFSAEAEEHLQKLNDGVLRLERGETDAELIADILRAAHTLKGSARMMGFKEINQVAHKLEDLLIEVREGRLQVTQPMCDLIFRALDTMDACRRAIVDGREGEVQVQEMADLLERTAQGEPLPPAALPPPRPAEVLPPDATQGRQAVEPEAVVEKPLGTKPEPEPAPSLPAVEPPALPATPVPTTEGRGEEGAREGNAVERMAPARRPSPLVEEHIRVSAAKLDKTIRLTGEVIAAQKRAEVRQIDLHRAWQMSREHLQRLSACLDEEDPEAAGAMQSARGLRDYLDNLFKQRREDLAELARVVLELQQDTLGLRMLPVSTVFDAFPRAVRDLARERGKELDLIVQGAETELDKQMLERISDPLMHMLRNAVDHGVEPPDEREAQGKARRGTIWLRAYPMGGSIIIEVQDDGQGLSLEAIRQKALQQGIVSEETLRTMSDREVQNLIFLPGFSTSQVVSDISGRGVGLDVVRRNIIEELKGDISMETQRGRGTRFILTLPLTLTTLRTLFIRVGGQLFGLPVTYVSETTRVLQSDVIQVVDREAIRLRDQIVPIASLAKVLRLPEAGGSKGAKQGEEERSERDRSPSSALWLYIVVAQVADERVGFVVGSVANEEDVLIKPLPKHMKRIGILAGATIAPDGTIIPILHIPGLIRAVRGASAGGLAAPPEAKTEALVAPHILVVDDSLNTREIEKSILEACGYQVDLAKDGIDALRVIDQAPQIEDRPYYDLLIVDIEMPRLDGLSLTEQLRHAPRSRYARVPIVIVSSRDKEEDRQRGLDVGADAYIVKGTFDQEDLTVTVASLLGRAAP
jgi:two-component system, chemotaxis family, sensor kinase CheA